MISYDNTAVTSFVPNLNKKSQIFVKYTISLFKFYRKKKFMTLKNYLYIIFLLF